MTWPQLRMRSGDDHTVADRRTIGVRRAGGAPLPCRVGCSPISESGLE
jgi:hypothetical protein